MTERQTAYLGLGSNEGTDRAGNIVEAVRRIGELQDTEVESLSSIIDSKADGFDGNDFKNACCRISTGLQPEALLAAVKEIERKMGRLNEGVRLDGDGRRIYSNRLIDIDILLYGDLVVNSPDLVIPHPRMKERAFVTGPLAEIMTPSKHGI